MRRLEVNESPTRRPRPRGGLRLAATGLALGLLGVFSAGTGLIWSAVDRLGPPPLDPAGNLSVSVLDREGRLLRAYTTAEGHWRLPVFADDVDRRYLRMLRAYEDKRFRTHPGVDPLAVLRAAWQFVRNGEIVSGASTLTMQVARLLIGRHDRSLTGKFEQMVRAIQLERRFDKNGIMDLYLRLAPFGGNLEGVRAASLAYFGKEPRRLSVAEAALLVALPQSPEFRRPDRHRRAAREARDRVLERMVGAGVITRVEADEASRHPVPSRRHDFPMLAPHIADRLVADYDAELVHRTTLARPLQRRMSELVRQHARMHGERMSASLIVANHATGDVLAHVGSPGYLDDDRFGGIDMSAVVRSPGSTLKPFIYGLAFEAGLAHPDTLIEDRPVRFGRYQPENFDKQFRGTISIREALQLSLNVPAVKVLRSVGPARLTGRLRASGASPELPEGSAPTLAVALGGLGLSLGDLAQLYAHIASGGQGPGLRYVTMEIDAARSPHTPIERLMSPLAAWYVADVLAETPPPRNARGQGIAYKTGTSYGHRDAWAVGFEGRHVIAAWVGRPDGAPTPGLTGLTAAAPMLFDAFQRLDGGRVPIGNAPETAIQAARDGLPPPLRRFRASGPQIADRIYRDAPLSITFPPDRAEIALDAATPEGATPVILKADGGRLPLTWLINGRPIEASGHRRQVFWTPDGPGFLRVSVIDSEGRTDLVRLRLRQ